MGKNKIKKRKMDKYSVLYTYSGILFSLKNMGNSDLCYNIEETWTIC